MLINLSNHPSEKWDDKQKSKALELYKSITDIQFPVINPSANEDDIRQLSLEYADKCTDMLKNINENNAVHIMGEMTFTFAVVSELLKRNISCVASTTQRIAIEKDGQKISQFEFVQFRKYNL